MRYLKPFSQYIEVDNLDTVHLSALNKILDFISKFILAVSIMLNDVTLNTNFQIISNFLKNCNYFDRLSIYSNIKNKKKSS